MLDGGVYKGAMCSVFGRKVGRGFTRNQYGC